MRGQRPKLTLTERRKRAARNERRGREPRLQPVGWEEQGRFYRYANLVVRIWRGRVVVTGSVPGQVLGRRAMGAFRGLAPLPKPIRRQIAAEAAERDRRDRLADKGLELPKREVWQPVALPSGVARP